jgi:hypothetical protein
MSENVGASTSHNSKGLHGLYGDNFTFYKCCYALTHYYRRKRGIGVWVRKRNFGGTNPEDSASDRERGSERPGEKIPLKLRG